MSKRAHDLVERFSGRLVVVEEVTSEQYHVDLREVRRFAIRNGPCWGWDNGSNIFGASEIHDFVKGAPTIIFSNGIALLVADMIVGGDEYSNGIGLCEGSELDCSNATLW